MDVNILSIFLVEDHPGHSFVDDVVVRGLAGEYRLMAPDNLPLRARWVMTTQWGIEKEAADKAVEAFLEHPRVHYVGATRKTLLKAYELARTLRHDVYDTFYLALALDHGAMGILTTDKDFEELCRRVDIEYENPIPGDILARFWSYRSR